MFCLCHMRTKSQNHRIFTELNHRKHEEKMEDYSWVDPSAEQSFIHHRQFKVLVCAELLDVKKCFLFRMGLGNRKV